MSDDENDTGEYVMDKIIHTSPYLHGNASEYIVPRGQIDITSHGMGSGIYGLSQVYLSKNPGRRSDLDSYTFTIDNPYMILSEDECEAYVAASKYTMSALDKLSKEQKTNPDLVITEDNFREIAMKFIQLIGNNNFDPDRVTHSLQKFWDDYHTRQDIVEMPINYILKGEEMDGVMSRPNVSCHSWSKGDVKFIPYPTYKTGDTLPVGFLLARKGIEKPLVDLTRMGYIFCGNAWVKQPEKTTTCRYCSSDQHKSLFCPVKTRN
jgi:hypothetical protein